MGDIDAAIPIKRTRLGVIVASTLLNPIISMLDLRRHGTMEILSKAFKRDLSLLSLARRVSTRHKNVNRVLNLL